MHTVQRRRFRRITVIQTATLLSRHTGSIAGEIRDFSPNGVLFAFAKNASVAALQNQLITIEFRPDLAVTEQYRLVGRIVRVFDLSVGVTVEHFPANAYRDLVLLTNQPNQQISTGSALYAKAQTTEALAQCHNHFKSFISKVIAHFYNNLGAKLSSSVAQVDSLEARWSLQNAYPLMAGQRNKIEQAYLGDDYLNRDEQDTSAATMPDNQELSLVDVNEFDEWVAVSQLVYKLNQDYAFDIGKFESRYAVLIGTTLNSNANPFGPHYIFQAFRDVLAVTEFTNQVKAVLYKALYESVVEFIDAFYRTLNETVAFVHLSQPRAVVSPVPARPVRVGNGTVSGVGHSAPISLDDYLQGYGLSQATGSALQLPAFYPAGYDLSTVTGMSPLGQHVAMDYGLNHLLEQLHQIQYVANVEPDYFAIGNSLRDLPMLGPRLDTLPGSVIPAMHQMLEVVNLQLPAKDGNRPTDNTVVAVEDLSQILDMLNIIQRQRASNGHAVDEISIKRQLIEALPQFENASMQDRLFHSIHLFDEMLSTPLADDALNSDIRSLLKKIELTLLKLALMDEHFLKSSDHPAQQTVNLLERFYVAANDMGKLFDPRLHQLLNSLTNQIVDQFERKSGVFDEVNKVLGNLLIPIEKIRQHKVAQIQAACQQREQLALGESASLVEDSSALDDGDVSGINLLRQANWLSVMVDDNVPVPYQLVWITQSGKQFVLTSRSATTIREFTRESLMQDMVSGNVIRLPEYDTPFMERSAHKIMLNTYERVYQQATHDPVSGLLNRKGMITQLENIFASDDIQTRRGILSMMMFDQLNLLFHNCETQEAEVSLMSLIGVIANEVQPTDIFARLGENTFAILLRDNDVAKAQASMQEVVQLLGQQRVRCQGKEFAVAVNVGITQINDEVDSVSKLLRSVGSACVAAKARGVNSVQVYAADSAHIKQEQSLFEWAGAIDRILHDNLLFLRCQRIQPVNTGNGNLPHYEILLGIDKQLATNPQEFILAAEKWNRSADIDLWVLQQSFAWLMTQGDKLAAISGISINLSGHSMSNEKILAYIVQMLQAGQMPADKIIFEITETAVMSRLETAQRFIETIRAFGCRFSLDDFGSGYSSFAYLKSLHVDYLKIDGIFIRDLAKSPTDFAMVKSMHQVGHALGLKTIAEYVENQAIIDVLSEIGVDYAQGYGIEISKPLSTLVL